MSCAEPLDCDSRDLAAFGCFARAPAAAVRTFQVPDSTADFFLLMRRKEAGVTFEGAGASKLAAPHRASSPRAAVVGESTMVVICSEGGLRFFHCR